jgi:Flp pilus assembly protein TadG
MELLRNAVRRLRTFGRNQRGGIAVQAAFLGVPLIVMAMGTVDIANGSAAKTRLQDALDSAALAAARSSEFTDTGLQAVGSQSLAANMVSSPAVITSSSFRAEGNKVIATASAKVTPVIANLWLQGDMIIGANAQITRAVNKIELALVLDTTGSMKGSKLSNLKTASKNLITTLSTAAARSADPDTVKIAIAPFSMTVRVGAGYRDATWLDQNAASPINDEIFASHANRFALLTAMGVDWGGCVESRQSPYDVQDTAPDSGSPGTLFTPFFAPDEPSGGGYENSYLPDVTNSSNWKTRQGYVAKYDRAPTGGVNSDTGYNYGPNSGCQLSAISRLSTDWDSLKTAVDAMTAVGDTNIPMGLMWGWHLLSPNAPFADGRPYGTPKVNKIVVLMTDGENTMGSADNNNESLYNGLGYIWQNRLGTTSSRSDRRREAMDDKLATLCANMKAQGIILYTVRVEVSSGTSSVLKTCASSTDKFYDVQNAAQLDAVFNAIAGSIENLRILK